MTTKKLSRILTVAAVAFAVAVLLAVSSMAAVSINVDTTVGGMEDGKTYTATEYNAVTNALTGDAITLTEKTKLSAGIWAVSDGTDTQYLFVPGKNTGKINFWNSDTNTANGSAYGGSTTTPVAGKWTISAGGAYSLATTYSEAAYASVCIHFKRAKVFDKAEGASNYVGATPKLGEDNLIQESTVTYSFTKDQVVPAKYVTKMQIQSAGTSLLASMKVADGHTYNEVTGTFTFVVREPNNDVLVNYTVPTGYSTREFVAPAEMANSNGYLVAMIFAPYATTEDDVVASGTDGSDTCYVHIALKKGENSVGYELPSFAAPEGISGGNGVVLGLDDECSYQIAFVTINSDGTGYTIGEWTEVTSETTDLAGLAVVRYYYKDTTFCSEPSDIFYINGDPDDRVALCNLNGETGDVHTANKVLTQSKNSFVAGYLTGNGACTYSSFPKYGISTLGSGWILDTDISAAKTAEAEYEAYIISDEYFDAYNNFLEAEAEYEEAKSIYDQLSEDDPDYADAEERYNKAQMAYEDARYDYNKANQKLAELDVKAVDKRQTLSDKVTDNWVYYAYDPDEIVPISDLNTYEFITRTRQGITYSGAYESKAVVYVMSLDGTVSAYEHVTPALDEGVTRILDFTDGSKWTPALPEDGYVLGIKIAQWYGKNNSNAWDINSSTYNTMPLFEFVSSKYDIDIAAPEVTGGFGVFEGLEEGHNYQYAALVINGDGTALKQGEWTDITEGYVPAGLYYIREVFETAFSEASPLIYVYGAASERMSIGNVITDPYIYIDHTVSTSDFVIGKWTGDGAGTDVTYNDYMISATGDSWLASGDTNSIATAEGDDILVAKQKIIDKLAKSSKGLRYGYEPSEIIPISELNTFTFNTFRRQGSIGYSEKFSSMVEVYVASPDGNVTVHSFETDPNTDVTDSWKAVKYAIDFTDATKWTPNLPQKGYVVGLNVIQWYGMKDASKIVVHEQKYNGEYLATMAAFEYLPSGYSIDLPDLPVAPAPDTLYVENGVVKGLDAAKEYEYTTVDINGKGTVYTDIEVGSTSFDAPYGILAIRTKETPFTLASDTVLVYIPAAASERKLFGMTDGVAAYADKSSWEKGKWTATSILKSTATAGSFYSFLDQSAMSGIPNEYLKNVQKLWLYQNTKESADTALKNGTSGWNREDEADPSVMQTIINDFYAEQEGRTPDQIAEEKLALQTELANAFATESYKYAFADEEIIPVDELYKLAYKLEAPQGAVKLYGAHTTVDFYVAGTDGSITPYTWTSAAYDIITNKVTVDVEAADLLPDEGWVVGIRITPAASVDDVSKVVSQQAGLKDPAIAHRFNTNQTKLVFYYSDYEILIPALDAPKLKLDGTTVTGFEEGVSYVYASVNASGIGAETAVEGDSVQLSSGLWAFKCVGDGIDGVDSDWVVLYVAGNSTDSIFHTVTANRNYNSRYNITVGGVEYPLYNTVITAYTDGTKYYYNDNNHIGDAYDTECNITSADLYYKNGIKYYAVSDNTLYTGDAESTPEKTGGKVTVSGVQYDGYTIGGVSYYAKDAYYSVETNELYTGSVSMKGVYKRNPQEYPVINDLGGPTTAKVHTTTYVPGKWSGFSLAYTLARDYVYPVLTMGGTGCYLYGEISNWLDTTDAAVKAEKQAYVQDIISNVYFSYGFEADEIIPMDQWNSYKFRSSLRQGGVKVDQGAVKTKVTLLVVTENGELKERTAIYDTAFSSNGATITAKQSDFSDNSGYIVGIKIQPFFAPEGTVILPNSKVAVDINLTLVENGYSTKKAEAPTLAVSDNGVITVSDYNENYSYVYSEDGENWIALTGDSFTATKASHEYMVKIVPNAYSYASEVATATSPAVVVVGTSLVLDGQIGTKVYFDIDTAVDLSTVALTVTRVDPDKSASDEQVITTTAKADWSTVLEENDGYYSVILYVPAKDADNVTFDVSLAYALGDDEVTADDVITGLTVTKYIKIAQELAAAGVQEFVDAKDVVNALEKYVAYADNYFAEDGALAEYDSKLLDEAVIADYVADGTPTEEGLTYYGTSLILEENVTIRHYFEKADGSFVHYDITDIAAQDIGTAQTFDKVEGFTLTYSVTNYIASMQNDSNKKLVSLVNAMYDYYEAAKAYFTENAQ